MTDGEDFYCWKCDGLSRNPNYVWMVKNYECRMCGTEAEVTGNYRCESCRLLQSPEKTESETEARVWRIGSKCCKVRTVDLQKTKEREAVRKVDMSEPNADSHEESFGESWSVSLPKVLN